MSEAQTRREQLTAVWRISPLEAWELVQAGRAVLVDTRDRAQYDEMHALGAKSVPLAEIEASPNVPALAAISHDQTIIFYCT
ncbi:MAG: rhodanese-like domain-containing protein [Candidatus Dormibacteraceae bacterium]